MADGAGRLDEYNQTIGGIRRIKQFLSATSRASTAIALDELRGLPVAEAGTDVAEIVSRPYESEADYQAIREMLVESFALTGPPDYVTIGDLDWWRFTDDDPLSLSAMRLWLDGDRVVGVAWPSGTQVDLFTHPTFRMLEGEMLSWAEQRAGSTAQPGAEVRLHAWSYVGDMQRVSLLEQRGFERHTLTLVYRLRELGYEIEVPDLPEGYRFEHVTGEADLERRVEAHRDAFSPSRMSAEKHRRLMGAPTYRPELDLMVIAPDETVAAFCIVWFDEANRIGVFEPVGCRSAHQRRGLAKGLMYEGCRRLQALGAITASVICDADSPAANRLYQAAGFREIDRNQSWSKRLVG